MADIVAGRLKLEVPHCSEERADVVLHAEKQAELLVECLKKYDISLTEELVKTAEEEPGCEKFLVYNLEVKIQKFERSKLLPAIRSFLGKIQELHFPHFMKSTVIIHSPSCFSNQVTSAHQKVPIMACYFGNVQGGVFINHWEVSFRHECVTEEGEYRMHAHFLYDQNELIKVTFENIENGNGQKRQERGTASYQIAMRLNFIRRIVVDNAVNNAKGRTRIYFELNCPVVIRRGFTPDNKKNGPQSYVRYKRWCTINRGRNPYEFAHKLAIADSPVFGIEFDQLLSDSSIYAILSRLRVRTGISIEFASFEIADKLYFNDDCPYAYWTGIERNRNVNAATAVDDPTMSEFITDTVRREDVIGSRRVTDIVRARTFSLLYLIECLFSRGAVVKDQLLLDQAVWRTFLELLKRCYRDNREACEFALERIVTMIDERKRIGSIMMALLNEYQTARAHGAGSTLTTEEARDGYLKVRKLVITQTRVIYVVPEMMMGNRVLREKDHDGTRIIRVTFRDDDNQAMRTSKTSKELIEITLREFLKYGVVVADRDFGYLGSSNSQMRDSGAYFMEKCSKRDRDEYREKHNKDPPRLFQPKIDDLRKDLGRFEEMESIPKLMARLGQCFTQSKRTAINLERTEYDDDWPDFIGGSNKKGKEYTFSDGVGMISKSFAADISKDMELGKCVPSCFQFRFRGMKGVVAVNPLLDEYAAWAKKCNIPPPRKQNGSWDLKLVFRPSQKKFVTKRTTKDALEIVKYSSPVPVSLNKPFICILDQVSEMQSYECHQRVTNRIEELLDLQLQGLARTILRESDCRNKLKELPRRIDIDTLSLVCGFQLSTEPFFQSLIKATIKYAITKQMRKQQIQIPFDKGRTMLGVVDETGQLQYGQVFVQYTENINLKTPPPNASKKILRGKVLLTKNPCIVAGDVRVFEAVDIPELHHLCDVIVFPIHGPRPHPDEMAGSDLDGDEYAVIWDEELMLERNEEAFDYTAEKPQAQPINPATMKDDMVDFYIKYITQDSVGTISNSFLFQADLYGINSEFRSVHLMFTLEKPLNCPTEYHHIECSSTNLPKFSHIGMGALHHEPEKNFRKFYVCLRLAKKISQAVDFTKTGLPPKPLVKDWTHDGETGKDIPPEKSERQPDFHFGNDFDPTYQSPRLMGRIYRDIKVIEDVMKIAEDLNEQEDVTSDLYLIVDGWNLFEDTAKEQLSKYKGALRAIMENYGIKTEGEVFSGCISEMRNRISDKDQDDMTFYNTNEVIEKRVTTLYARFRTEFFLEFGGYEVCTRKMDKKFASDGNLFHRLVYNPTLEMKQKAVAYYRVCYETAQATKEKILSFGWIAFDVLARVRQENIMKELDVIPTTTPIYDMLKKIFDAHTENNPKFARFSKFSSNEAAYQLKKYTTHYEGLSRVMFIVSEWAERNQLFEGRLQSHHICLILIRYGTGLIEGSMNRSKPLLDKVDDEDDGVDIMDDDHQVQLFLGFFEYLASRDFRKLPYLRFDDLGYASVFLRGEWLPLRQAAVKTYYNMVFNHRFDEMKDNPYGDATYGAIVRECEPFVIELPENVDTDKVERRIIEKAGVEEVALRRIDSTSTSSRQTGRVTVSARGTVQSLRTLRDLVTVKPLIKSAARGKEISDQLCRLTYANIMR